MVMKKLHQPHKKNKKKTIEKPSQVKGTKIWTS